MEKNYVSFLCIDMVWRAFLLVIISHSGSLNVAAEKQRSRQPKLKPLLVLLLPYLAPFSLISFSGNVESWIQCKA